MPWIPRTRMDELERVQLEAGRLISGAVRSSPREAVLLEADLSPLCDRARQIAVTAYDRSTRLGEDHPRRIMAQQPVRQRTQQPCWRARAHEEWVTIFGDHYQPQTVEQPLAPWDRQLHEGIKFMKAVPSRSDQAPEALRETVTTLLRSQPVDIDVYTDGSAEGGLHNGGAGVVAYQHGVPIWRHQEPAGRYSTSYQAEQTAASAALKWLLDSGGLWTTARICTDSLALLQRLNSPLVGLDRRDNLERALFHQLHAVPAGNSLTICWLPSHCGIPGNEEADTEANLARDLPQADCRIGDSSARGAIRERIRSLMPQQITHDRSRATYTRPIDHNHEANLSREDQILLARCRTGHLPLLRGYTFKLGKCTEEEAICRHCGLDTETPIHAVCQCPRFARSRIQHHHQHPSSPEQMVSSPDGTLAILREFLTELLEPPDV